MFFEVSQAASQITLGEAASLTNPSQAIAVAEAAARTEAVSKIYGSGDARVVALNEVTVDITRGRFTAIMGPSGSGKSTLMHCMAGLDTASSGRVYVGEVE